MTREGGAQPGEYLAKYASDRVRTVAITWLGSTMGCAECHDHKYDPFTQRDFYSLGAFFADVKQWGVYQDYDYTPNPELKGWSNDHPFPPEIEVESPYLKRRREQLRRADPAVLRRENMPAVKGTKARTPSSSPGSRGGRVRENFPTGWKAPAVKARGGRASARRQRAPNNRSGGATKKRAGDAWTFRMKPGAGGLARIGWSCCRTRRTAARSRETRPTAPACDSRRRSTRHVPHKTPLWPSSRPRLTSRSHATSTATRSWAS